MNKFLKVQSFIRRYKDNLKQNTIIAMKKLVKENMYREGIDEDQYFFFNVKLDKNGNLIYLI